MKPLRPWLYFALFQLVFGILSTAQTLRGYYGYFSLALIVIFSVIIVWRWWKDPHDPRDVGFGMSRLPLPRRWKRWLYDEHDDRL
jgi:hypothetical protein